MCESSAVAASFGRNQRKVDMIDLPADAITDELLKLILVRPVGVKKETFFVKVMCCHC